MKTILGKKKSSPSLAFCFFILFSLNSLVYGQSKKETIKWINTNGVGLSLIENPSLYFSIQKVNKDSIYYVYNNRDLDKTYSIALKDILYEDIATIEKKNLPHHQNVTYFAIKVRNISKEKKNGRTKKVETITDFLFPYENEEKAARVVKAIMNLSQLSGARENKQFF